MGSNPTEGSQKIRNVAQLGRASGLGPEGRRFKSCRSDMESEMQIQLELIKAKIMPGYWYSIDVGPGWYQLVIDCDRDLTEIDPSYEVCQIKEKYGGLRYYFSTKKADLIPQMDAVVEKYEEIASRTCEVTGRPGVLMQSRGWYKTLDPNSAHAEKYSIVDTTK